MTPGRTNGTGMPHQGRPHVVVVGDIMLDRDILGRADRIAPDAPVPVLDVTSVQETPGGAGLAALLAASAGAEVTLIAPVADDRPGELLQQLLAGHVCVVKLGHDGPTRRKTRVRSAGQSLLRMDDGGPGHPTAIDLQQVRHLLDAADAVLVSDYGAGVTRDERIRDLLAEAARRARLVWDPHPRGGTPVPGAAVVTPNLAEAAGADHGSTDQPDLLAHRLRETWAAQSVCVTAGAAGAFLALANRQSHFVPAPTVHGGDPCGAGDRFAATVTVALGRGALITEAVAMGVADASAWVGSGGAAAFRLTDPPTPNANRPPTEPARVGTPCATDLDSLAELAGNVRAAAGGDRCTLVATGGCFDIVHAGHVATLQAARRLGDALVVLINSDASVGRLKGPTRPVVTAEDRARVLAAFDCVDAVVIFDDDDPRTSLAALQPDIWVKGGDYGATELPETATVEAAGGRVVLLPYLSGRSTTSIIERSRQHTHQAPPASVTPINAAT